MGQRGLMMHRLAGPLATPPCHAHVRPLGARLFQGRLGSLCSLRLEGSIAAFCNIHFVLQASIGPEGKE